MRANKLSKFNKIKYKDLAIAVALSGASLLLVPTTAQADATNTPSSDQQSSVTQTQNEVSDPNISSTTTGSIAPNLSDNLNNVTSTNTNETETTNTSLEKAATTQATSETTPVSNDPAQDTETATATATQTNNTAPLSESNDTSSQPANETSTLTEPTPTVESTTLTSSATDLKPASYAVVNGQTQAPYSIPANGVSVSYIPNTSPVDGKCTVYIQAVDLSGNPYGTKQFLASVPTNVSTAVYWNWRTEAYLSNSFKDVHYSLNPWSPTYNSAPFGFYITDKDAIISVYMVRPSMSAHFVYYDETAGKVIAGGSFPYSYNDHPEFQTSGVRPPMAVLSDGKLTVDDPSNFDMTNIDAVNYFGPTGMIFNNSAYVLDLAKSGNVTPLDYAQWPLEGFTKVFYYKEAAAPAITVDAVDQYGDLLKTFSNTQLSSTNTMINADDLLPDSADIAIANNTFAGINIIKSGSVSGQPDETDTYQMTPTQYADFLNSQHSYDSRLLGDYQKVEIQLAYKVDTVKLYIQPVDPVGNKVGNPIPVGVGSIGKNATIFAPPVTGYSPQVASVSVIVQPDQGPINFPYISATDIDPSHGGTYLYEGGFDKLPDSGVVITNTGAVSTDPTAEHTISVQAVDTDGNPLGAAIPVTSATANTTAELDWSNSLISLLNKSVPNVSQYQLWNADALVGSLSVPVKTQDVVVDVIYALPKVTTTFNFVDMTTGKTLLTETNTWDLNDPTNGYTYKTQGIRPPMTVIDPTTGQLVADDPSSDPVTDPADLPFFGPAGNIYNTGAYQLNSLMSGLTTPTRYIKWPSANLTKTFNYMESPDPTFTVDAVNQNGTVIKTFSAPTVVSTLPAPQLKMTDLYPADADTQINGYTLTGFHVHATGSYFNGTDYDNTVAMTPDQYAQFITSPGAQSTIDERALAAHQNYHIQMTYVGNTVNLTVQPVDETGAKIGNPITVGTGQVGSTSTITAPEVSGYQAVTPTSELEVAPDQSSVSVTYKKATTEDPGTTGTGTTTGGTDSGSTGTSTSTGGSDSGSTDTGSTTSGSDSGSTGTGSTTGGSDSGSTGTTTTTGSDSGSTGTGTTTSGSDSGNTDSGATTGSSGSSTTGTGTTTGSSDSGSTDSGSTAGDPDPGNTSSGSTTSGSDSGSTGTGTTTGGSDSGNTSSGTTTGGSDSGNTSSGTTTGDSDSGNTSPGTTTGGSDSGNTSSGTTTGGSDSGSTGSATTTGGSDSGSTDSGSTTGDPDPGNTGTGSTAGDSDSGNTSSGTTTGGSDSGSTDSGSTTGEPDPGNTGTGTTTGDSDSGSTDSGSTAGDPDPSDTGSGTDPGDPDPGNTGTGSTTSGSDSGSTGSGTTTGADSGSTGSGTTTGDSDSGNTSSGTTTGGSDSGNTGSGTTTGADPGNTGTGTTTGSSDPGSTGTGSTTGDSDSDNASSGSTTSGSDSGNTGTGTTTSDSDFGNTNSGNTETGDTSSTTENGYDSSSIVGDQTAEDTDSNAVSTVNVASGVNGISDVDPSDAKSDPTSDPTSKVTVSNISTNTETDTNSASSATKGYESTTTDGNTNTPSATTDPTVTNIKNPNDPSSIIKKSTKESIDNSHNESSKIAPTKLAFKTNNNLPQTGNKLAIALSIAGITLMGITALCIKKAKKHFTN